MRIPTPEAIPKFCRRDIRIVRVHIVQEQEKGSSAVFLEPLERGIAHVAGQTAAHLFDARVVVALEALIESEHALHPGARDEARRGIAALAEDARQGLVVAAEGIRAVVRVVLLALDRVVERKRCVRVVACAVAQWELPGEERSMSSQGPVRRREDVLVDGGLARQRIEVRRRGLGVALDAKVIGPRRVERHEQDTRR